MHFRCVSFQALDKTSLEEEGLSAQDQKCNPFKVSQAYKSHHLGTGSCRDCACSLLPRGNMCDLHTVGISVRGLPPVTCRSNDLNPRDWTVYMISLTRAVHRIENAQRRF